MPDNFTIKLVNEWLQAQSIHASEPESAMIVKLLARLAPAPVLLRSKQ